MIVLAIIHAEGSGKLGKVATSKDAAPKKVANLTSNKTSSTSYEQEYDNLQGEYDVGDGLRSDHGDSSGDKEPTTTNSDQGSGDEHGESTTGKGGNKIINMQPILKKGKNLIWSPYSLAVALKMVEKGAVKQTLEEIKKAIDGDNISKKTMDEVSSLKQVNLANSAFVSKTTKLLPKYKKVLAKDFKSHPRALDFTKGDEAVKVINDWASNATKGKIKDLLEEIDPDTALVLCNAIYFKGQWNTTFDVKKTEDEDFFTGPNNSNPVKVKMMTHNSMTVKTADTDEYTAIALPFTGNELEMVFILSKKSGRSI